MPFNTNDVDLNVYVSMYDDDTIRLAYGFFNDTVEKVVLKNMPNARKYLFANMKTTTDITLTDTTSIESYCFDGNTGVVNITAPNVKELRPFIFNACSALKVVDTPKAEILNYNLFGSNGYLSDITFGKITVMNNRALYGCTGLSMIIIGKGTATDLYFSGTQLTSDCLHDIIENLADLSGQTAKKLSIGLNNIARLSTEDIKKLESKNWQYQ